MEDFDGQMLVCSGCNEFVSVNVEWRENGWFDCPICNTINIATWDIEVLPDLSDDYDVWHTEVSKEDYNLDKLKEYKAKIIK